MSFETTPLVSVAMASHNGEEFLRPQLDSILAQTHKNLEIVVSDDASMDGTESILQDYASRFNLSYQVNSEPLGPARNFERAISQCRGRYIALADQDDIWLPKKIEILVNSIDKNSLVYSNSRLANALGEPMNQNLDVYRRRRFQPIRSPRPLYLDNCIFGHAILFDAAMKKDAIPFPEGMVHDLWLPFVATLRAGIAYVDRCLVTYRQHDQSVAGEMRKGKRPLSTQGGKSKLERRIEANHAKIDRLSIFAAQERLAPQFSEELNYLIEQYQKFDSIAFNFDLYQFLVKRGKEIFALTKTPALIKAGKESLGARYFQTLSFA